MPAPRTLFLLAGAVLVVLLAGTSARRAGHAVGEAQAQWHRADSIAAVNFDLAAKYAREANAADRRRAAAEARADSLARVARDGTVVYRTRALAAPDTCRPVIQAADSVISAREAEAESLRAALQGSQDAVSTLHQANDTLTRTIGLLRGAGAVVVAAARPSLLERLTPRPGLGLAAGVDPDGHPRLIAGVTLGWSF